ncbi:hypothetical protein [Arthrobacter koreensis]|uniref:hypothetical protein n=1 Tax=Arthrobacter koreensis TaxID=199136 RepID=UPI0036DD4A5A
MNKFKSLAQGFFDGMAPKPNPYAEQAKELVHGLEPATKAQVLAQLAVAEEIYQLRSAVDGLSSAISLKS